MSPRFHFSHLVFRVIALYLVLSISLASVTARQTNMQQASPPSIDPEVLALTNKAEEAKKQFRWEESLRLYQEARQVAVSKKDTLGEAIILNNVGDIYDAIGKRMQALESYQNAIPLFKQAGSRAGEAIALSNVGGIYSDLGEPKQAQEYLQQALSIFESLGVEDRQATTLINIGYTYARTGQSQQALVYFNRAMPLLKKAGNHKEEAVNLSNIGYVYGAIGQLQQALKYQFQALALFRSIPDVRGEATVLSNIGATYTDGGQPQQALKYYQMALPLRRKVQDKPGEAATLTNMGRAYADMGRIEQGLEYYQQSLSLHRAVQDKRAEAITLNDIGAVYADLGQPQRALQYYRESLSLRQKVQDKRGEAITLNNIGGLYAAIGQLETALEYYQQALLLRRDVKDLVGEAATLNNMGLVYATTGQSKQALLSYQHSLEISQSAGHDFGAAVALNNIGSTYASLGDFSKAQQSYLQALSLRRKVMDKAGEAVTLTSIGNVLLQLGKPEKALGYFEQALPIHENFYRQINAPTQIGAYQRRNEGNLYGTYAVALVRLKRLGDALAMVEHGRSKGLAQLAAQNRLPLSALLGRDASRWQQANRQLLALDTHVRALEQRYRNTLDSGGNEAAKDLAESLDTLRDQQRQAEANRARLLDRLMKSHPGFAQTLAFYSSTYDNLRHALLTPQNAKTLFLEYAVVDNKTTLLFALSGKDGLRSFTLPVGSQPLATRIAAWRDSIEHLASDERQQARLLSTLLLRPLEQEKLLNPRRYHAIVIVSDGPLLDAPFDALLNTEGRRLIQHFALSTPFSLSMLTWPASSQRAANNLLAIANPIGPKPSLPRTEEQARQMLPQFLPADLLTGLQPTRREVLRRVGKYRVLHFGVHGEANAQNGLYSRLLLAGTTEAEQELTAAEITEHPLAAQLAVLSACETMRGQKSGGEGLLGLAWAFRAAGCPSVVASQWKVDESSTASLMRRFYRELRKGAWKDVALQKAMLGVMKEAGHEAPYYWAAFQVMGKIDPLRLVPTSRAGRDESAKRPRSAVVKIAKNLSSRR